MLHSSLKILICFIILFLLIGSLLSIGIYKSEASTILLCSWHDKRIISGAALAMGSTMACCLSFYTLRKKLNSLKNFILLGVFAGLISVPLSFMIQLSVQMGIFKNLTNFMNVIILSLSLSLALYTILFVLIGYLPILTGILSSICLFYMKSRYFKFGKDNSN